MINMLTPEEQNAENALDSSFKGSIEVIKNALKEEDLNTIREVIGNITVWSGHLGDRPKWLSGFNQSLNDLLDIYGNSDAPEAKTIFFEKLRLAYHSIIIENNS
ncbi:hypothetical protein [Flammeovirga sp. OC4]|uniref:hypothetical protein n=1 Tax=Flammeovirga sp. OC4 TaxID=1382345 RepID=UPI0012E0B9FC|nr:hypothetical protein [Flammeovirga sp. OC4]